MENKNGDTVCKDSVYKALFDAFAADLHNFLYYKFGNSINVADEVQEAFVKLWENCHKVEQAKAKSFLFTVANNHALNEIAKLKTRRNFEPQRSESLSEDSPDFQMEEKEYDQRLTHALNSLTDDLRMTFLMNRVEGKKHQEIADLLGISRKAVEKRIYKALRLLREQISEL